MAFKSGRTLDNGIRSCVFEDGTLYVSPGCFAAMQLIVATAADVDVAARNALKRAGMLDVEIDCLRGRETKVVVDFELPD